MPAEHAVLNETYLVRLWRDNPRSPWRATVHKVRTGEETHFARTEDMLAYLQTDMGAEAHAAGSARPATEQTRSQDFD